MSPSTIPLIVGVISVSGGALAAFFALRGQLAQVQVTREGQERQDVWRLVDEKNKDIAQLRADIIELQAKYQQQAARLDEVEAKSIKDQFMIERLQAQVRSLGGTP